MKKTQVLLIFERLVKLNSKSNIKNPTLNIKNRIFEKKKRMIPSISWQTILLQIEQLDYMSKIRLLQAVLEMLKVTEMPVSTSLLSLQGLGSSLWATINIDDYVATERNLWD